MGLKPLWPYIENSFIHQVQEAEEHVRLAVEEERQRAGEQEGSLAVLPGEELEVLLVINIVEPLPRSRWKQQ